MSETHFTIVITVFGVDRPGIIESISRVVVEHGASWQESRMARLSGRFAGVVEIRTEQARADGLGAALLALGSSELELHLETVRAEVPEASIRSAELSLVGQDRPGILNEITAVLASHAVDVVHLETGCQSAPMSGEMLFHANARLRCPEALSIDKLRETLEQIGADLMVDVSLVESTSED